MKDLTNNSIKLLLLCIACALSYAIWFELDKTPGLSDFISKKNSQAISAAAPIKETIYKAPKIETFDEIVNRPLFFEDRTPYVYVEPEKLAKPTKQKKKSTPKKTKQYVLNAVIITSEKKLAIIQSGRDKVLQRLSPGESIDGWILENIEPRLVSLRKGSEIKNLELEVKTGKAQKKSMAAKTEKTDNTKKKQVSTKKEDTNSPDV